MFTIVSFSAGNLDAGTFGYEKIYEVEKIKSRILRAKNLVDATNYKNKNMLIVLEDYAFDEGAVKIIAEKKKACFLIDLAPILNSYGTVRAIRLAKLRTFLRLCIRYGAFYALADFAPDEFDLRTARELIYLGALLGLNEGQARFALQMLPHYLEGPRP